DRKVDFQDLVAVAQNYAGTGKTFAQGDFDFDGETGFSDLVLIAQKYGTTLTSPTAAASVGAQAVLAPLKSQTPLIKASPAKKPAPPKKPAHPVFAEKRIRS